jgi:guanylate kinase
MKAGEPGRKASPLLFVLSGPSGVGKDVVLDGLRKQGGSLHFAVTATTRRKRRGETHGRDYHFVSRSDFEEMMSKDELLEWANVYGNLYGVPKREVQDAWARGLDVVVKVDVQGAATIKRVLPKAVFIFVAPPSMAELEERLRQRKTESLDALAVRLKAAKEEMKKVTLFDYVVVNREGEVALAVSEIEAIIAAERLRVKARRIGL